MWRSSTPVSSMLPGSPPSTQCGCCDRLVGDRIERIRDVAGMRDAVALAGLDELHRLLRLVAVHHDVGKAVDADAVRERAAEVRVQVARAAVVDVADEPGRARVERRGGDVGAPPVRRGRERPGRGQTRLEARGHRLRGERRRTRGHRRAPRKKFAVSASTLSWCGSSGNDYEADPACKAPDRRDSAIARGRAPVRSSDPPASRIGARRNRTLAGHRDAQIQGAL